MELILKEGMAYLNCQGYMPRKALKVFIKSEEIKVDLFIFSVKINKLPSRKVSNSFIINLTELDKDALEIKITAINKVSRVTKEYIMDPIKLQRAVIFGNDTEKQYPASIKLMKKDIVQLKNSIKLLRSAVVEIGKRGEIL